MGASISPVSAYRNSQYDISILVWKVNSKFNPTDFGLDLNALPLILLSFYYYLNIALSVKWPTYHYLSHYFNRPTRKSGAFYNFLSSIS